MTQRVSMDKFFDDMATLVMSQWMDITVDDLAEEHGITIGLEPNSLEISHVSSTSFALRYTWTSAGGIQIYDVCFYVFGEVKDEKSAYIERHYRIRCDENIF